MKEYPSKENNNNLTIKGYLRKKHIIDLYGKKVYRIIFNNSNNLTKIIKNKMLIFYLESDIVDLIKNPYKFYKCKYCGTTKNLVTYSSGVVYKKCYDCQKKKKIKDSKNSWIGQDERRKKQSNTRKEINAGRQKNNYLKYKKRIELKNVTVLSSYENYKKTKLFKIRCTCGNIFYKWIANINDRLGCEECYPNTNRILEIDFLKECKKYHNKYCDYLKTKYITMDNNILVIDKKYGEYETNAGRHYRGAGLHKKRMTGAVSKEEKELLKEIKKIYLKPIIENTRKILNGKEIDIYLPGEKIGIEYNGLYWHCEYSEKEKGFVSKKKHLYKTELAEKKGIKLIHINTHQLRNKKQQILNIIKTTLKLNTKKYLLENAK